MSQPILARSEVPAELTWNTASVYASDADWEEAFAQLAGALPELASFQGRLGTGPGALADWFSTSERLLNTAHRVYFYASMLHNTDTGDQRAAAMYDRGIGLLMQAYTACAFAEPEILAIGQPSLREWMAAEPRLAIYAHRFDEIERNRPHVRSAEVEELLGAVRTPFESTEAIHGVLCDADLRFMPAHAADGAALDVAQGNITALLASADRETRRSAWESYADAHLSMKNTIASCLATGVKQHVFLARARRYGSSLEAALAPSNVPAEVFHNLIATFRQNLPIWQRYWRVRRRALGYDTLHVYDIKAPLAQAMPKVPLAQALEWICAGMRPLGDEYVSTVRRGVEAERWVDLYPNRGKRMGAYSHGVPGTQPFILMSYNDDIFSMSTLAHELGHSMHSYLAWQTQPLAYADYTIFAAEVASNFNQALVRAHLLESNPDPDFQIAVIEEAMSNFHRYFFIMPTLARFELEIHERAERGEALTAESMIALMADLFAEGYGDEVQQDRERIGITWGQFSTHLYSNFYVYQYATGIAAAHALAADVLKGAPGTVESYLAFLKAGGSLDPLDALKLAGVDMTTSAPVETAFGILSGLVDRLERLVDARRA